MREDERKTERIIVAPPLISEVNQEESSNIEERTYVERQPPHIEPSIVHHGMSEQQRHAESRHPVMASYVVETTHIEFVPLSS
jgi:hypothetical protein